MSHEFGSFLKNIRFFGLPSTLFIFTHLPPFLKFKCILHKEHPVVVDVVGVVDEVVGVEYVTVSNLESLLLLFSARDSSFSQKKKPYLPVWKFKRDLMEI